MWKIGPEWAAQHSKKVPARIANCGVQKAASAEGPPTSGPAAPAAPCPAPPAFCTSNEAGINRIQAPMPTTAMVVRQSYAVSSQPTNGETVIGATPTPAETSDTARLR